MREFTEQELVRREKLNKIREFVNDPYGHRFSVTENSQDNKDQ